MAALGDVKEQQTMIMLSCSGLQKSPDWTFCDFFLLGSSLCQHPQSMLKTRNAAATSIMPDMLPRVWLEIEHREHWPRHTRG